MEPIPIPKWTLLHPAILRCYTFAGNKMATAPEIDRLCQIIMNWKDGVVGIQDTTSEMAQADLISCIARSRAMPITLLIASLIIRLQTMAGLTHCKLERILLCFKDVEEASLTLHLS